MTNYTVVSGDTLFGISRRFSTTIDIIVADNSIIVNKNLISIGWVLRIRTPQEVATEKATNAKAAAKTSATTAATASSATQKLTSDNIPVVQWDGSDLMSGQTGRVTILRPLHLVKRLEGGNFSELRVLNPPEKYRTFERITGSWFTYLGAPNVHITALYNLGGNQWVYDVAGYVLFETIPAPLATKQSEVAIASSAGKPAAVSMSPTVPYFEPRLFQRPVLQIKRDNKIVTMEMRILGASGNYANQIQPNRTNAGWFINMGGSALTPMAINGIFLDTQTNQEFDDFMEQYDNYLTAYKDGDFYSSAICTLYYKGREYKGLIAAFNYADTDTDVLLRRFSMQFLILKEKGPNATRVPTVIDKKLTASLDDYYSDLRYLLINPITGLYGKD